MQIDVEELPGGWSLLEAVVCLKVMDADGDVRFCSRATSGLRVPEAVGMMHLAIADQTHERVQA